MLPISLIGVQADWDLSRKGFSLLKGGKKEDQKFS